MFRPFEIDMTGRIFDWDDQKNLLNFRKHGVYFSTAARVFRDPNKLIRKDEEHTQEVRYDVLGKVGKVFFVVCTFKKGNVIRLISARQATAYEKEIYKYGEDPL